MHRIAIIDIGSNSARLVISHIYQNGAYNMVFNQKETLRLSQKVDASGNLTQQAFTDTLRTMEEFAFMCKQYKADTVVAVATAAVRNAGNGSALIRHITEKTGINLHVIPGKTEAFISYLGVINTLDIKDGIIFDLGGGSTELILFKDRKIVETASLPLGAVNTTAMFDAGDEVSRETFCIMRDYILKRLQKFDFIKNKNLPLISVGGTARTVTKMIQKDRSYPSSRIHNYTYKVGAFFKQVGKVCDSNYRERRKIPGVSKDRSDIIAAGMAIISALIDYTVSPEIITSGCGLREGLFYDYYAKFKHIPLISENILQDSTENVLRMYTDETEHPYHVAKLALAMFNGWQELHGLPKRCGELLHTAALLHDIGITINYYSHARHSGYMILNGKLFGLTHGEQMMTAAIAAWHNNISKSYFSKHAYRTLVTEEEWKQVATLALLLSLAESLDYSQSGKVLEITPCMQNGEPSLKVITRGSAGIEYHQAKSKKKWFKKTFGQKLHLEFWEESRTDSPEFTETSEE